MPLIQKSLIVPDCLHCVIQSSNSSRITYAGRLHVVGVLMQEGAADPNPSLQFALNLVPDKAGDSASAGSQSMQLESLLPRPQSNGHRPYVHYVGSLTTPPCSEEVQWFVFADTITIPSTQVEDFQLFADKSSPGVYANSRPLQPLFNRPVDYAQFL